MSTTVQRWRMAVAIVNFEARRDRDGHLEVYKLPPGDGGGTYEVAGLNDKYNKDIVDVLVKLLKQKKFDEAESLATSHIAQETDRVSSWSRVTAVEFYLRDSMFNRGAGGAARILQHALGVSVDGAVGDETLGAVRAAEMDAARLLTKLRAAREHYERTVVGRDESSSFWKGLVNRWNNALATARTFPMTIAPSESELLRAEMAPSFAILAAAGEVSTAAPLVAPPILPALRIGMSGPRVMAWQYFLKGQGFDPGAIDGAFGEHSRDATAAFQAKYGLPADGVAGSATLLKAVTKGFELIEAPSADLTSSNYPPRPSFAPLITNAQREAVFGHYDFVPAPTPRNPEGIRILGTWERDNMVSVPIPQLRKALGPSASTTMQFHRLAAKQLKGLWAAWESAGLLDRVLTFDGSFNPRFVRGSRTTLSNHAFGSGFDINYPYNKLGQRPALVGEKGSVRELVPIANDFGFWWGGHYDNRKDGMHFEVAWIKP